MGENPDPQGPKVAGPARFRAKKSARKSQRHLRLCLKSGHDCTSYGQRLQGADDASGDLTGQFLEHATQVGLAEGLLQNQGAAMAFR